jgi:hypothetical protein
MLHLLLTLWVTLIIVATAQRALHVACLHVIYRWRGGYGFFGTVRKWLATGSMVWLHVRYGVYAFLWFWSLSGAWSRSPFGVTVGLKTPVGAVYLRFHFRAMRVIETGVMVCAIPTKLAFWRVEQGMGYRFSKFIGRRTTLLDAVTAKSAADPSAPTQ